METMCMAKTDWEKAVEFHGHSCPGLAVGYRAAKIALRELAEQRAEDEELVAVVENDACGVDAVQVLTGCTLGKGNLILRDYGKQVFTFFSRNGGRAVRISARPHIWRQDPEFNELRARVYANIATPEEQEAFRRRQEETTRRILEAPEEQLFEVRQEDFAPPSRARIFSSVICAFCGEAVGEHRARRREGKFACIPCAGEEG
jgi:formylmethanofuran dehydrogenase subunit E